MAWDILLVLTSVAGNLCNKCPNGYSNKTAVKVILSVRSLVSIEQQSPRRPCDTLSTLLAMITHLAVQSSTWTLFQLLAMITPSAVQSSTHTLFTLLAMITHLVVQSSTWTLFTLLVMTANLVVQTSTGQAWLIRSHSWQGFASN